MTRPPAFAALALVLAATAASAEAPSSSPLGEGFAALPALLLEQDAPLLAYAADPAALARAGAAAPEENARARSLWHGELRPLEALLAGGPDLWREKTGLESGDLRFVAGFGQAPARIAVLGFSKAESVEALLGRLAEGEFSPAEGAEGVLINGEPLRPDFGKRDPADPWRGGLGQAVALGGKGAALIHAALPEPVVFLQSFERGLLDAPAPATALAGAEAEAAATEGELLQAMLFSPALGLQGLDPAILLQNLDLDPAELRAELEAQMEAARIGLPPYLGGIFAEAQIDGRPALILSLAYPDCEAAEAAAQRLALRWKAEFPEPAAEVSAAHHEGAEGLCAATALGVAASAEGPSPARAAYGRILNRDFPLLRIGAEAP